MTDNYILAYMWGDEGRGANYALLRVDDTLLENIETCRLTVLSLNGTEGTKPTGSRIDIRSCANYWVHLYSGLPGWLEAAVACVVGVDLDAYDGDPILLRGLIVPEDDESVPAEYSLCGFSVNDESCSIVGHVKHEDGELNSNCILEALRPLLEQQATDDYGVEHPGVSSPNVYTHKFVFARHRQVRWLR